MYYEFYIYKIKVIFEMKSVMVVYICTYTVIFIKPAIYRNKSDESYHILKLMYCKKSFFS